MVLLVLALAVTTTKPKRLTAEKGRSGPSHYYSQTGGGEGKSTERIYNEVGEGTGHIRGKAGHYQELNMETMETMEKQQYEILEETTAKEY